MREVEAANFIYRNGERVAVIVRHEEKKIPVVYKMIEMTQQELAELYENDGR
jgi:hypothetical protein